MCIYRNTDLTSKLREIHLHGGVSTTVKDLSSLNVGDGGHENSREWKGERRGGCVFSAWDDGHFWFFLKAVGYPVCDWDGFLGFP